MDTPVRQVGSGTFATLLTTSLVSSLIMLDSNIVAVSLPSIGRSLGASFAGLQWVISAYVLTYAALLLAAGNLADLKGRRRTMIAGLIVFAVASAGCGAAGSVLLLDTSRAVQGVGGALLLTSSLAVIAHEFAGTERTRAMSFWGASLGVALAAGPVVGGIVTDYFGWRWVFLVNVPACAALIWAASRTVAESRDPAARRLDLAGIATFGFGLGFAAWALADGNYAGWLSPGILGRLAAAALLLGAFVVVERRQARPMVDFALFRKATFAGAVVAMLGYGAAAQVMVFLLPPYLQDAYGFTPLGAGLAMAPFALPMVLAPRASGWLAGQLSGRALLAAGLAVTAGGNLLFWTAAREHLAYPWTAAGMLVAGCGAGLLNGQTVKVLQGAAPQERAGMASGLASTARFVGILVSVAVLGALLATRAAATFAASAAAAGFDFELVAKASTRIITGDLPDAAGLVPEAMRARLLDLGRSAYSSGFAYAAAAAAIVAATACLATLALVRSEDTAPAEAATPCKPIDCRHPL